VAEEEQQEEQPKSKKKGLLKWIILMVLFLGLAGGGYYVYTTYFAGGEKGGEAQQEEATEEAASDQTSAEGYKDLVTLPTFVVNLADPLGRRYLKLSMDVEVTDEKAAQELTNKEAQVRDAIILLLSSKTFQDLSTIESKLQLKKEIVERLNQVLGGPKVLRVFFTEMVVQ
jgi:flagellar FliL protein